jgi:hypothetical protein
MYLNKVSGAPGFLPREFLVGDYWRSSGFSSPLSTQLPGFHEEHVRDLFGVGTSDSNNNNKIINSSIVV